MLVLTRRAGETLLIGDNIEVTIVEIQGDKLKIGIEAPKSISILRKELVAEAKSANKEAASPEVSLHSLAEIIINK